MKRRAAIRACSRRLRPAALLPACGRGTDDGAVRELRRGNGSEPDSIDPQLARMEAAMTILRDCYEGLVSMAPDGTPVAGRRGGLDRLGGWPPLHFQVPRAARWSNGDRLVAEDFVAALRRLVDSATASQYALMLEPVFERGRHRRGPETARRARRRGGGRRPRSSSISPSRARISSRCSRTRAPSRCIVRRWPRTRRRSRGPASR